MDFVPKDKHSSAAFTVSNDSQPANLRSRPDNTTDNVVAVMPDKASGIVIGKTQGSELVSGAGKVWYYVRLTANGGYTYGYVYSAHVKFSGFGISSGEREQPASDSVVSEQGRPATEMSLPIRVTMISVLCLPVVAALFMLRPKKRGEGGNVKDS